MIHEASYGELLADGVVRCRLCPAKCRIKPGLAGICRSRLNLDGRLVTDNYGELVTMAVDPIEKKPLYHFYPGSRILSIGANCCNLACRHCQNWTISQEKNRTSYCSPERLAALAVDHATLGVAFTYTEPMVWFEYIRDAAPLLRQAGQKVVLVSNGYINAEPLAELAPLIDAANIDLKGIRPEFYRRVCKGKIEPILHTIRYLFTCGIHLELTNLIIPGENDSEQDLADLIDFVASVSPQIPLHFSAYHPDYKMAVPATPATTLQRAYEMASDRLQYVFVGNLYLPGTGNSYCPACRTLLIERTLGRTGMAGITDGKCSRCGTQTGIIQ
jgi:pyruvate formate lyase activating enzyme